MTYVLLRVLNYANETVKAIAVRDTKDNIVWFPKAQITTSRYKTYLIIRVPKWLADKYPDLEFEEDDAS